MKHLILSKALLSSLAVLTTTSYAGQEARASSDALLDEIIVTAQKREQSLQDVGIAVTAFSGEQLDYLGVTDSAGIVAMTPNVSMSGSFGGQLQQFSIRGVTQNDFTDHTESPTAIYVDEAYIASGQGQLFATFDLERVEVLKGPQGTLYGRNATGGTVGFITRKPTKETEGYIKGSYGTKNSVRVETALGGPVSDKVSIRGAFLHKSHDSIYDNQISGEDDVWNDNTFAGRLHMLFDLSDKTSLLLSGYYAKTTYSTSPYQSKATAAVFDSFGRQVNTINLGANDDFLALNTIGNNVSPASNPIDGLLPAAGVRPVPGGDFFGFVDPDGSGDNVYHDWADDDINGVETYGATANMSHQLGDTTNLTVIVDYKTMSRDGYLDCDAAPFTFNCLTVATVDNGSVEVRLDGKGDGYSWVTGIYYLNIDANVDGNGLAVPFVSFTDFNTLDTNSYSAFGQVEFDLTDKLSAITGIRVTREKKDFYYQADLRESDALAREFFGPLIATVRTFEGDAADTLITGKAQLDWRPTEDLLIYGSFNRGIKAGSFNAPFAGALAPAVVSDEQIPYGEEVLYSYELGFKSTLMDGAARLNGSFFYYDYKDYQAYVFFGLTTRVSNNDARYVGGEVEFIWAVSDTTTVMLTGSYIDAEVKDVDLYTRIVDRTPAFTPKFQGSGFLRQEFPVSGGAFFLQGDFNYKTDFYYQINNFDAMRSRAGFIGNLRAGYNSNDDKWGVSVAVENVGGRRYETFGFDLATFCGCNEVAYNKPRWVTVGFHYNY